MGRVRFHALLVHRVICCKDRSMHCIVLCWSSSSSGRAGLYCHRSWFHMEVVCRGVLSSCSCPLLSFYDDSYLLQ